MSYLPEARQTMWTFSVVRQYPSNDQAGYKLNTQESLSRCCTVWHSGRHCYTVGRCIWAVQRHSQQALAGYFCKSIASSFWNLSWLHFSHRMHLTTKSRIAGSRWVSWLLKYLLQSGALFTQFPSWASDAGSGKLSLFKWTRSYSAVR